MTNRFTSPPPTELITAKLEVLLESVNSIYQSGGVSLQDDIISAYNEAISLFYESLDGSIVGVSYPIMKGMPADPVDYNVFTLAIRKDLEAIFLETGAADRLISSNFNTIVALREQVLSVTRRIASKVGDYLLYVDPSLGDGYFFGDSFNSAAYLDLDSSLEDKEECLLNQEEGVIVLPLDGDPARPKIIKYTINTNSNGIAGNNQQTEALPHNKIEALGDGQPDTWFEYERVTQTSSSVPLVLDLTLTLGEAAIINHIHLSPVQFGTATPVKIIKLETSLDGTEYQSIKEEVPLADFLSETEEDVFILSGKTSKYSGEGFFSFLPRRCKYVHIVLEQHTPYEIESTSGSSLLRYAIGLKDINIFSRKFKTEGTIVSKPIEIGKDVSKISIWASENPIDVSSLADIKHEISCDDGASWVAVQPQGRNQVVYPEVVNINNSQVGAIQTGGEVTSLRHKITMARYPDAFTGQAVLESDRKATIELVSMPTQSPSTITLQNSPISDTVHVSLPLYGSFSCPRERGGQAVISQSPMMSLDYIEFSIDNASTETVRFRLPYENISNLDYKIRVFVNGEQWGYSSKSDLDLSMYDSTSRIYFLNDNGRELQFVHLVGGTAHGKLPGAGARIQVCLDGDNPILEASDEGWVLSLTGSTDGFVDNVYIVTPTDLLPITDDTGELVEPDASFEKVILPAGNNYINLTELMAIQNTPSPVGHSSVFGAETLSASSSLSLAKPGLSRVKKSAANWLPPLYDPSTSPPSFMLVELDIEYGLPLAETSASRQFHNYGDPAAREDGYVAFIDGQSEFFNGSLYMPNRYTFNSSSGILYFGRGIRGWSRLEFHFKYRDFKILASDEWTFYREPILGKIDTSKLLLKPSAVKQFNVTRTAIAGTRSVQLADDNTNGHSWWNQKVVPGSIVFSPGLVAAEVKLIEVPYIDGYTELKNTKASEAFVAAQSGNGLKTFTLPNLSLDKKIIGGIAFSRSVPYPGTIKPSQFLSQKTELVSVLIHGDWYINPDTGVVSVMCADGTDIGLGDHIAKYEYIDTTAGVDRRGLYSIDYDSGEIYFATSIAGGTITCRVSQYTAFYNFSEVVSEGNISKIDETAKTIELRPELCSRFMGNVGVASPRPKFVRVGYEYYDSKEESLKDLEPYFSPICKDFALRAITKDMIGEI